MEHPTLFQFRSSHYNEKARWALDYKGVPHVRRTLLPGFHAGPARNLTGRTEVPILVRDGEAISDSTRIIAALEESHPEPPLYPEDEEERRRALELEDYFDEEVGPYTRHVVFYLGIGHPDFVASLFAGFRGRLVRGIYARAIGMQRRKMVRAMNLVPEAFEESCKRVDAGFARIEAEVQPSGYLVGSRFSVADLAGAALLSIAILPDDYPHPPVLAPPAPIREYWAAQGRRPGAEWVREMYRRHRGTSAALSE